MNQLTTKEIQESAEKVMLGLNREYGREIFKMSEPSMNQIKQKIKEIGLSQREISKRLGKNASYLAGVLRTGLSTAKQAELMDDLEIVAGGGTILSDEKLLELVDDQLEKSYSQNEKLKAQLLVTQEGNAQLRSESDKYFNELNEAQNAGIKALESYGIVQKQLTQTQKYLMVANQNCEVFETKYRKIAFLNWALCVALVVVFILWVVV